MSLRPIRPTLRTLHNGSNDVAKVSINVPAGDDITVSEYVAAQLQAQTGAFKDGAAPAPEASETTDETPAPVKAKPSKSAKS